MKTTKIYTLLALLLMAGGVMAQNNCWDGTVAEAYAGGNGTPENPYQIATAEQLALLAQQTNNGTGGDACYILIDNICLNENPNLNPVLWTPIGHGVGVVHPYFTGRFDGNKMSISGLVCETNSGQGIAGLFGYTYGAEIQNVELRNCRVIGTNHAGTLVGHAGFTNVSHCRVNDASVTCENGSAGGLVGFFGLPYGVTQSANDTCCMTDCSVEQCVIVYGRYSGGLVGLVNQYVYEGPKVPFALSNCTGNAMVTGEKEAGGLVGFCRHGRIDDCRCWNEVYGVNNAGGLVGQGIALVFSNCQNGVCVTGGVHCGGMAGCLGGGIIVNCDNYGQICGDAALTIGGMVGWFESSPNMVCKYVLRNCHNYGGVMGARDYAGGLVGYAVGNVTEILIFVDCVNSGDMYQNALCGGILGMKSGFNIRILNVYNTGNIGAQYLVGGIVGQMEGTDNLIVNTYNAGLLTHEIENYVCPRGAIVGHSAIVQNCQACYWLSSDEYGSNGQGPEVGENSSAFDATQSPTVWSLESVVFDTQDLLEALNAGAEYIESQFPDVGTVSRWREDFDTENGGFPVFGTYDAVNDPPSVSSVEVYPNPGQTTLNIRTTLQNARVEVYDTNGRFVHSQAITENVTAIDATDWTEGVYVWKVYTNNKEVENGKWIKE